MDSLQPYLPMGNKSRPRYHRLLQTGSTQKGAFNGAFLRFKADFRGRRIDLNLVVQGSCYVPTQSSGSLIPLAITLP